MIRQGDRLENPVTGEALIFHETAAQTGGQLVRVETIVQPDGFVTAAHIHPAQSERFEVLDGTLGLRIGSKTVVAGPHDVAIVPAGTPHRFWNAGSGEARFVCEIRPALRFESLIETMFTLAAEGKTDERGLPGPLQLAVIAREHFDTVRLPFPPEPLQRARWRSEPRSAGCSAISRRSPTALGAVPRTSAPTTAGGRTRGQCALPSSKA
jgi:mannose-6-phosphate isomerase-like protein (cupin superfamily)